MIRNTLYSYFKMRVSMPMFSFSEFVEISHDGRIYDPFALTRSLDGSTWKIVTELSDESIISYISSFSEINNWYVPQNKSFCGVGYEKILYLMIRESVFREIYTKDELSFFPGVELL